MQPVVVRRLLGALVLCLAASLLLTGPVAAQSTSWRVERISGLTPVITAAGVSQRTVVQTDTVVLARVDAYPDALAGAPLARALGAPVLLTDSHDLSREAANEVDRLDPTRAVLLGGPHALDPAIEQRLAHLGVRTIERIGGATRWETAAAIGERVTTITGARSGYVALGEHPAPTGGWPDAIAVSALAARQGRPILLTRSDSLPAETSQAIARLGLTALTVVGGEAVVGAAVPAQLTGAGLQADRLAGPSRFETSLAVAEAALADGASLRAVWLVSGGRFQDALATSVAAAASGGVMLLTDGPRWETSRTRPYVFDHAAQIDEIWVVGNADDMPVTLDHELVDADTGRRPAPDTAGGVRIAPGQDIQAVVDAHPPGTHFVLGAGVHHLQTVMPRSGDRFTGEPGAVLDGSVPVDVGSFSRVGNQWVGAGPTEDPPPVEPHVEMLPGREREAVAFELWSGHRRMRHVNSAAEVDQPGTWYLDAERDLIVLFDDPATLPELRVSIAPWAFHTTRAAPADGVVITNLTLTRYANEPSRGVIDVADGRNWVVEGVTVIDNHALGVRVGPGLLLRGSRIVRNGQMGIGGSDVDGLGHHGPITVVDNEVAFNGELGFDWGWEGGSVKFGRVTGLRFANNWVHNHPGPGPWIDEQAHDVVLESNLIEHNGLSAVMYEISTAGRIRSNTIRANGVMAWGDLGAGVWISNSSDVEISANVIEANRVPLMAQASPWRSGAPEPRVQHLHVHDNDIRIDHLLPGMRADYQPELYDPSLHVFEGNRYRLRTGDVDQFWWGDALTAAEWQGLGFDANGTFDPITAPAGVPPGHQHHHRVPYGAS